MNIVDKEGNTPLFLYQPPFLIFPPPPLHHFLEFQDVPTFHRSLWKTKVLNNSCNQFVYRFYPQIGEMQT